MLRFKLTERQRKRFNSLLRQCPGIDPERARWGVYTPRQRLLCNVADVGGALVLFVGVGAIIFLALAL